MLKTVEIQGLAARRGAFRLLMAVLWQGRPLDGALDHALQGVSQSNDRALARSIASYTLRYLQEWDDLIDSTTAKPLPDDSRARMVLRLALTQAFVLNLPHHAVVATALPLIEGGPRRLVHGILGRLLRSDISASPSPRLPVAFAERWQKNYGDETVAALELAGARKPQLDLCLKDHTKIEHWLATFGAISLLAGHVRLPPDSPPVPELPGFQDGAWWVQDLAAQLPATLVGAKQGETIIDLCAAPGGKTLGLAATGATITAVDNDGKRMKLVIENLKRTGLAAKCIVADGLKWSPPQLVDAVLLDAPCSATGTYRRHPDVLHLRDSNKLADICAVQAALLDRALGWLKPGGRLIYAVCSLEPEEGEHQIASALIRHKNIRLVPVNPVEISSVLFDAITPDGCIRTLPSMINSEGGLDGFYIARLIKISA